MSNGKSVSLVLGSGSARGLTHIGVIDELENRGYTISSIAGCSIGALVGGIYATGKMDIYKEWLSALDKAAVFKLLDFSFDRSGLFKGERLIGVLMGLIGDHNIENLPIKFTAIATDINREKEIWFSDGSLFEAIRASISVPTLFTPHNYRGMELVDGGLLNPVPVVPTVGDTTDLTVAVNLNARSLGNDNKDNGNARITVEDGQEELDREDKYAEEFIADSPSKIRWHRKITNLVDKYVSERMSGLVQSASIERVGLMDTFSNSIEVMQNSIAHTKMAANRPDILIEIPRNLSGMFDFHKSNMLIEFGRSQTKEALDVWEKKISKATNT